MLKVPFQRGIPQPTPKHNVILSVIKSSLALIRAILAELIAARGSEVRYTRCLHDNVSGVVVCLALFDRVAPIQHCANSNEIMNDGGGMGGFINMFLLFVEMQLNIFSIGDGHCARPSDQ